MPAESAPTPPSDGAENPAGSGQPDIPVDPYRPQLPPKDRLPAGQEQPDGPAGTGQAGQLEQPGTPDAETGIINDMYSPYIESGDMTETEARDSAAEVIEVAGKLDDESLVAAHQEVSGIFGSMQNWEEHLDVDSEAVGRSFDALVGARKAGDAEAVGDIRGMMGVEDQDLWDRALNNLDTHIVPGQSETANERPEAGPDSLLGPETSEDREMLDQVRNREKVEELFSPEDDEKFLDRLNEVGEAYSTTTRVMQALPYIDPERAHRVYDMALDSPDSTAHGLAGVAAGLENLTVLKGEDTLPLWRKALATLKEGDGQDQDEDKAFVVASAIHDTLDRLGARQEDPDAGPAKVRANEALITKLDNLAYEGIPPSFEQRQETTDRMKHLFDEVGLDGSGQWN